MPLPAPSLTRRRLLALLGTLPASRVLASPPRTAPRRGDALPPAMAAALRRAGIPAAACSVVVQPLRARQPRLSVRADVPRNPASVLKLVPTYVALSQLGPAFRWHTPVYAVGTLRDGTLAGDLAFAGSGDPHLMADDLWRLLLRLRQFGLRRIDGNVLVDRSAFALAPHDPGAFDGDALAAYNVGPDAFLVNFDALRIDFAPGADGRVGVAADPPLAGFAPAQAPRLDSGGCDAWKERLAADFSAPLAPRFAGAYAASCGEQVWNLGSALPRDSYLHALLGALFAQVGIDWHGEVVDGRVPAGATRLDSWASQPLAQIVRDINKFSNNVMAQQLFLTLALQAGHTPADFADAAAVTRQWLEAHALAMPDLRLDNGCGLSRDSRISADDLTRLLRAAWMGPVMPDFVASLPLAGYDGTLASRYRNTPLAGLVRAKTGTLRDVLALAGYVQTADGARSSVVALINDPRAERGWDAIDALLEHTLGLG
ncbi:D-alanyl-D-alanine carboxypeptidase DacB precursor [mine drainage metagenome]|uniref:D-alanyl-D-alanine carboxypeptidase DacB n=1 Tax=mine drainage metagenome TaxID=410659 RepID=A0A1J5QF42_9ZZZZ